LADGQLYPCGYRSFRSGKSPLLRLAPINSANSRIASDSPTATKSARNLQGTRFFPKRNRDINIRRIGYVCHLLASRQRRSQNHMRYLLVDFFRPIATFADEVATNTSASSKCSFDAGRQLSSATGQGTHKKRSPGRDQIFSTGVSPYEEPLKPDLIVYAARNR